VNFECRICNTGDEGTGSETKFATRNSISEIPTESNKKKVDGKDAPLGKRSAVKEKGLRSQQL
jgi:hypothetical protein